MTRPLLDALWANRRYSRTDKTAVAKSTMTAIDLLRGIANVG
jgi:hypothetical protein